MKIETPVLELGDFAYRRNRDSYICKAFVAHYFDTTPARISLVLSSKSSAHAVRIRIKKARYGGVRWFPPKAMGDVGPYLLDPLEILAHSFLDAGHRVVWVTLYEIRNE